MKDKEMKNGNRIFTDDTDRALADILSPLRETVIPDDGFSLQVMQSLPRRDISLWVILAAVAAGIAASVAVMGWGQTVELYHSFLGFFLSLMGGEMPSVLSQLTVAGVVAVLAFAFYSLLDTDDYQCPECR